MGVSTPAERAKRYRDRKRALARGDVASAPAVAWSVPGGTPQHPRGWIPQPAAPATPATPATVTTPAIVVFTVPAASAGPDARRSRRSNAPVEVAPAIPTDVPCGC